MSLGELLPATWPEEERQTAADRWHANSGTSLEMRLKLKETHLVRGYKTKWKETHSCLWLQEQSSQRPGRSWELGEKPEAIGCAQTVVWGG